MIARQAQDSFKYTYKVDTNKVDTRIMYINLDALTDFFWTKKGRLRKFTCCPT